MKAVTMVLLAAIGRIFIQQMSDRYIVANVSGGGVDTEKGINWEVEEGLQLKVRTR